MPTQNPTVRRAGDWLYVYDQDGTEIGRSIAGHGPHAPAAVDVAAALLNAVSDGLHITPTPVLTQVIDPALDLTTLDLSPEGLAMGRALQEHGMYLPSKDAR